MVRKSENIRNKRNKQDKGATFGMKLKYTEIFDNKVTGAKEISKANTFDKELKKIRIRTWRK